MEEQIWLAEFIGRFFAIMIEICIVLIIVFLFIYYIEKSKQKNKVNSNEFAPENPKALWECPECSNTNPNTTFTCNKCGYRIQ